MKNIVFRIGEPAVCFGHNGGIFGHHSVKIHWGGGASEEQSRKKRNRGKKIQGGKRDTQHNSTAHPREGEATAGPARAAERATDPAQPGGGTKATQPKRGSGK